jgi:hypothetical protein
LINILLKENDAAGSGPQQPDEKKYNVKNGFFFGGGGGVFFAYSLKSRIFFFGVKYSA